MKSTNPALLMIACIAATLSAGLAQAAAAPSCQVTLSDSLNKFTTQLEARKLSPGNGAAETYLVSNHTGNSQASSYTATFANANAGLVTEAGVPSPTKSELLSTYAAMTAAIRNSSPAKQDGQLTWTLVPGSECSDTELSLIQFFVMEWFYFG